LEEAGRKLCRVGATLRGQCEPRALPRRDRIALLLPLSLAGKRGGA